MPSFRGIRTRVLLIAALIAVTTTVTGGSLLIIRSRIHQHVSQELSDDLTHSLATLQNLQQQRRDALIHENALLADLSDLKALMTTHDQPTIQDGATLFWKDSGSDLFALADPSGRVLTVYTKGKPSSPVLETGTAADDGPLGGALSDSGWQIVRFLCAAALLRSRKAREPSWATW